MMKFLFFSQKENEADAKKAGVDAIIHYMLNISNLCIMSKMIPYEGGCRIHKILEKLSKDEQ
ncbi:MAG: hypothetical protein V3U58_04490 [Thermodesulfobacteriota bacterium]